jgi:tetratricopeptide (TPR) repeat protein
MHLFQVEKNRGIFTVLAFFLSFRFKFYKGFMSKKKKSRQQPQRPSSVRPHRASPVETRSFFAERDPVSSEKDPLYKKIFTWSAGIVLLMTILLSLGSGINGDDEYQVDYSEKLVNYYLSMGADTAALNIPKGNMHYYGGFFDLTAGLANRALGFEEIDQGYHDVRHVFIAVFGFLGMLFTALLVREIAGWRAGILALFLMFLSPRFLGHSLMNPKDIPFAAGFAIALYYMALVLKAMPRPGWRPVLGLVLGIALALATRAGGLLLVAYFLLFAALDFLIKYGLKGIATQFKILLTYAGYALGIAAGAYFLAVLAWPAALVDPLHHPLKALSEFSNLGVRIRLLFMGQNVMSDDTVWYYPVLWIVKTIPLYALLGLGGGLALFPFIFRRFQVLPTAIVYFAAIFPLVYVIYKDSTLHDGWRHLMFVYPPMVALAALFWIRLEMFFEGNKTARYLLWGILGLAALEPALFIVRNPHYPYVYFNPLGGGLKGAFGHYETDYWGVSVKQAIDWMEDQGILSENMQDTLIIGTTFYYNVSRQTLGKYKGKVLTRYARFNQRYTEKWDYGIFPSRFIRGPHLLTGNWPNSKTVHSIKANGVPLTAIEKESEHYAFRGEDALKRQDWESAFNEFSREIENHPDNELAWLGMANVYINTGRNPEAVEMTKEALRVAPDNENALYFQGLALLRSGDNNGALNSFQRAVEVNDDYYLANYYLGLIYQQRQEWGEALRQAQIAIQINPRFKNAYELAASIYEQQGDQQNAARYREAAARL